MNNTAEISEEILDTSLHAIFAKGLWKKRQNVQLTQLFAFIRDQAIADTTMVLWKWEDKSVNGRIIEA